MFSLWQSARKPPKPAAHSSPVQSPPTPPPAGPYLPRLCRSGRQPWRLGQAASTTLIPRAAGHRLSGNVARPCPFFHCYSDWCWGYVQQPKLADAFCLSRPLISFLFVEADEDRDDVVNCHICVYGGDAHCRQQSSEGNDAFCHDGLSNERDLRSLEEAFRGGQPTPGHQGPMSSLRPRTSEYGWLFKPTSQ